jgi:hypothetical protein
MSQYVLIANSNGNPLRPSELSAQQVQRYTVQLLALRHVYEQLLSSEGVTSGQAQQHAASCVFRNAETVRLWTKEFERRGGMLSLTGVGKYHRDWIMDDPIKADRARRWLREELQRKLSITDTVGAFTIQRFHRYLCYEFLPSYDDVAEVKEDGGEVKEEGGEVKNGEDKVYWNDEPVSLADLKRVSLSTALVWAKNLDMVYMARKKSYYCDTPWA